MGALDSYTIRAAIIDLDGTLFDTAGDFTAALNGMLSGLGARPIDLSETIEYIGKGTEHLIASVLGARYDADAASALFDRAYADYQTEYQRINGHHATLYPGAAEGVAALREGGIRLACVTNKPLRFAAGLLAQFGLAGDFDHVFGGDSFARKKPDPLPMREACRALGVTPAETVALGDSENDALAARAAGIASLIVPYGYNHGRPVQDLDCNAIVGTLLEAAALILKR
ncbi:phosphoglycolate phosphatase [Chitinasiproducens palmae]|uniref:Phosphoglycolate phosphatase n=1 Tax=Chitinasiproducens palmae TaxID=1770053 RepID=A0A1H2PTJ8_9BURK|nr:phosphoglycolate phosphatase [Chitinasiproducens palmae]SDV50445.1 phosphoglycolate phosphatase [Chitinasiproducens palmae]